jgi:hypothetical protein
MHARYELVGIDEDGQVTIRDIGPWHIYMTVTNDIEHVVAELYDKGILGEQQTLLYYDSHGELDQVLHVGREFVGFAPGGMRAERTE